MAKTFFNYQGIEIVQIEKRYFALNDKYWNGEIYFHCWETDENGFAFDNDEEFEIRPISQGIGEPDEDGDYEEYEITNYEIL